MQFSDIPVTTFKKLLNERYPNLYHIWECNTYILEGVNKIPYNDSERDQLATIARIARAQTNN